MDRLTTDPQVELLEKMQNQTCTAAKKTRCGLLFPEKQPDFRESSRINGIMIRFLQKNKEILLFCFSGKMNKRMKWTGQR
jgi:hypothetical protein